MSVIVLQLVGQLCFGLKIDSGSVCVCVCVCVCLSVSVMHIYGFLYLFQVQFAVLVFQCGEDLFQEVHTRRSAVFC